MKSLLKRVSFAALALLIGAGGAVAQPQDVKLGLLMPLTGRYAESGASVMRGVDLVIKQVNAGGGIKSLGGAKVVLVTADTGSDPAKTSLQARKLMADDRVSFILGPYSTPEAETFMPVADRYQVGGVGLQTTVIPKTPYFATLSIPAAKFGEGYGDLVRWLRGRGVTINTVAITYANNDYGQVVSKAAAEALTAQGVKVLDAIPVEPTVKDMTPIVLKVKSLDPDAVISAVYLADGVLLHRARFNLGYDKPVWIGGSAGFSDDKLWGLVGDEVARKTLTASFGLAFFSADAALPGMQTAIAQAKEQQTRVIDQSVMFGVQAAHLAVEAFEKAASADAAAVNAAFRALRVPARSAKHVLPFISGDVAFDENGLLRQTTPLFVQWRNGEKVLVYPPEVASAQPILK
ncbi:ABC transporter substrate-binding protein [Azospirillum sp.]|uniref:ABC transporter substrate-binding protein n=1 Tax=Azospirillum sp. TaxID=34012 RepID=UPI002D49825D|nr:ABC transporter substrate-binding protein [Azospirillum sp.]HYD71133.1 ABC transporter substrate-binding protein [Azospirillum sp.]HYH23207.1 ABC transporter substrate-binding protein [Azospirillum sp.]